MIRITEIWADPAPPHKILGDTVSTETSLWKDINKTLSSPFFVSETFNIFINVRRDAGLGAIGNSAVNSIVINGPEELS